MKPKTGKRYVWTTWLTKWLAGEIQCGYNPWVRVHFKVNKRVDPNFDSAKYTEDHTAGVTLRASFLRGRGYAVTLEDENGFKYEGTIAIVGGKPDIIAVKHKELLISDVKTGKQRHSDWWQVLIYIMVYQKLCPGMTIRAELVYNNGVVEVPASDLTPERRAKIGEAVKLFASNEQQPAVPSSGECMRCDVDDCEYRKETPIQHATTTDF